MKHLEVVEHGEQRDDEDDSPDPHRPDTVVDAGHSFTPPVSATDQPFIGRAITAPAVNRPPPSTR